MRTKFLEIKSFFEKHERIMLPTSMVFGFIVDSFTLNRADQLFDNAILLTHLCIVAIAIFLIFKPHYAKASRGINPKPFLPYLLQYSFGALFSGMIVLYAKSGTLLTSFPFFLTLLVLLISNEFIHKKYPWLTLQISIFFVALTSYATIITPVLFRQINTVIFILGTFIAALLIYLYMRLLERVSSEAFKKHEKNIWKGLIGIFIAFHILYFTNLIPPIPLSLKEGGIYHSVMKTADGNYLLSGEEPRWYEPFKDYSGTFHLDQGKTAYAFSSVFAPTKITETIYHKWYYLDTKKDRWILSTEVPITISGGRDQGFRGYSQKSSLTPGTWRVDITNTKGQVIGRLKFKVVN